MELFPDRVVRKTVDFRRHPPCGLFHGGEPVGLAEAAPAVNCVAGLRINAIMSAPGGTEPRPPRGPFPGGRRYLSGFATGKADLPLPLCRVRRAEIFGSPVKDWASAREPSALESA
ncbi:MAG: hypothetical protein CW342_07495 [Thermoactinomycetaceae bacterium]|uniref:hypothetical protein n=1 Tax=Planifilum fulgidum TaxID=201973 RepID=UPI000B8A3CE8|nr:hypothetical protein [Planifilum fulgidum]MBO2496836.1 hypothetical protein [Bacillota bacterium]MBO2532719.1 hypothetical protein [Thermoactinomycetaceae bacterium]